MSTLNLFGEPMPAKEKQVIPPPAKKIVQPEKQIVSIPEKKEVVIAKQPVQDNRTPEQKIADWRKENFPNYPPKTLKQLLQEKANKR